MPYLHLAIECARILRGTCRCPGLMAAQNVPPPIKDTASPLGGAKTQAH